MSSSQESNDITDFASNIIDGIKAPGTSSVEQASQPLLYFQNSQPIKSSKPKEINNIGNLNEWADIIAKKLEPNLMEAIFELGVQDDGSSMNLNEIDFKLHLEILEKAASLNNCKISLISSKENESGVCSGYALIRKISPGTAESASELRVACCGNVDAGKSTLLGVLTTGILDDGRGKTRRTLFKHKHEIETGRTSSVGMEIMGFDETGNQVTRGATNRKVNLGGVGSKASKVITLLDLAGHEKYLKTTVFGMTGCAPDYVMLIIGSNAGIIGMTKEHLGLALALNVPVLVVVTKIDMCPPNILDATMKHLAKTLKSPGCRKIPMFIKNMEDVAVTAQNFVSERICPIFQISSVSGNNVDLLKQFINLLPSYKNYDSSQPVEYQITDTFSVPGVGTVVSGTVLSGIVHVGDNLLIGPDSVGQFHPCMIKSIQRKRINVPLAAAGHTSTFALKKIRRSFIRKGMVIVSKDLNPYSSWEFEAEVLVLYHSSTIQEKYQTMLHCGPVRQTARIVKIFQKSDTDVEEKSESTGSKSPFIIRTGDRAIVRFRFLQYPEYLKEGARLLFREGRTKGVGKVTRALKASDLTK